MTTEKKRKRGCRFKVWNYLLGTFIIIFSLERLCFGARLRVPRPLATPTYPASFPLASTKRCRSRGRVKITHISLVRFEMVAMSALGVAGKPGVGVIRAPLAVPPRTCVKPVTSTQ